MRTFLAFAHNALSTIAVIAFTFGLVFAAIALFDFAFSTSLTKLSATITIAFLVLCYALDLLRGLVLPLWRLAHRTRAEWLMATSLPCFAVLTWLWAIRTPLMVQVAAIGELRTIIAIGIIAVLAWPIAGLVGRVRARQNLRHYMSQAVIMAENLAAVGEPTQHQLELMKMLLAGGDKTTQVCLSSNDRAALAKLCVGRDSRNSGDSPQAAVRMMADRVNAISLWLAKEGRLV